MVSSFRLPLLALLALAGFTTASAQSVTISMGAGTLYNDTGTMLTSGRLVLLVADTNQNGFGALFTGSHLTAGSFLNGDDQILGRAFTEADGGAAAQFNLIPLASNPTPGLFTQLTTGDHLAIIWFSLLGEDATQLAYMDSYGLFSSSSLTLDGDPWQIPSGGSTISINFLTQDALGTHPETDAFANLTVSAVPEPATYAALLGLTVLGLAAWRRRSAR